MKVAREHLYKEVWAEPMTTVAKRYEVSSNYLARICERLNIPRPPRGYWQQLEVGLDVEKEPLPAPEPGDEIEWCRDGSTPKLAPMSSKTPRVWEAGERPERHPLLVGAREHFDHAREGRRAYYVRPHKKNLVDILVPKPLLDRALKVASNLFLDLEDRGQRVMLAPSRGEWRHRPCALREDGNAEDPYELHDSRWTPGVPTIVLVGEIAIGLTLFEIAEEVDTEYKDGEYVRVKSVPIAAKPKRANPFAPAFDHDRWRFSKRWLPSGRLGLHAYATRHNVEWSHYWREKSAGDLDKLFVTIAKELEKAAPNTIAPLIAAAIQREEEEERKWKAQQAEWERQRREEERKAAEQRRREEQLQREKKFEASIAHWRMARDIREYIAESRAIVEDARLDITADSEFDQHLKWAAGYADRIDPLRPLREEVTRMLTEHDAKCEPCRERRAKAAKAQPSGGDQPGER
jgi:hypothetical protein